MRVLLMHFNNLENRYAGKKKLYRIKYVMSLCISMRIGLEFLIAVTLLSIRNAADLSLNTDVRA